MQYFVKIGHTRYRFLRFLRWPQSSILDFQIFKYLVDRQIGRPNMHRRAKFHQNRSNGCGDIGQVGWVIEVLFMQLFCKVILDCWRLTVTWCIKCCIDACIELTVFHRKQKQHKRYSYITDAPCTSNRFRGAVVVGRRRELHDAHVFGPAARNAVRGSVRLGRSRRPGDLPRLLRERRVSTALLCDHVLLQRQERVQRVQGAAAQRRRRSESSRRVVSHRLGACRRRVTRPTADDVVARH